MKWATIYADPPWNLSGGKNGRKGWSKTVSPDAHYPLMTLEEIGALGPQVQDLAEDNSHLYLWVPNGLLPQGLTIMNEWGWRYVTNLCWAKTSGYGLGQYFRTQHELLLFGVRGKPGYKLIAGRRAQARSLVMADRGRHSEKPAEVRRVIERVSPGPYLELFSREKVPGWSAWGNEVKSDVDIKTEAA